MGGSGREDGPVEACEKTVVIWKQPGHLTSCWSCGARGGQSRYVEACGRGPVRPALPVPTRARRRATTGPVHDLATDIVANQGCVLGCAASGTGVHSQTRSMMARSGVLRAKRHRWVLQGRLATHPVRLPAHRACSRSTSEAATLGQREERGKRLTMKNELGLCTSRLSLCLDCSVSWDGLRRSTARVLAATKQHASQHELLDAGTDKQQQTARRAARRPSCPRSSDPSGGGRPRARAPPWQ